MAEKGKAGHGKSARVLSRVKHAFQKFELFKRKSAGKLPEAPIPKSVPEKNLEKMRGNGEGEMIRLLNSKTIGGAGTYKGHYSCSAANFWFDKDTGEISVFSNRQPEQGERTLLNGKFVVAIDLAHPLIFFRIAGMVFEKCSELAESNLKESQQLYNKEGEESAKLYKKARASE